MADQPTLTTTKLQPGPPVCLFSPLKADSKSHQVPHNQQFTKLAPCSFLSLTLIACRARMKGSLPPHLQSLFSNSLSCSLFLGSTGAFHPCSAWPHTLLGDHSRDEKLLCSPNLLQASHRASAEHSSPSQLHSCPIFCASLAPTWIKERRQLQPSSLPLHSTRARWIFPKGAGRR